MLQQMPCTHDTWTTYFQFALPQFFACASSISNNTVAAQEVGSRSPQPRRHYNNNVKDSKPCALGFNVAFLKAAMGWEVNHGEDLALITLKLDPFKWQ